MCSHHRPNNNSDLNWLSWMLPIETLLCSRARRDFTKRRLSCCVSFIQERNESNYARGNKRGEKLGKTAKSDLSNWKWNVEHHLNPVKPMSSFWTVKALRKQRGKLPVKWSLLQSRPEGIIPSYGEKEALGKQLGKTSTDSTFLHRFYRGTMQWLGRKGFLLSLRGLCDSIRVHDGDRTLQPLLTLSNNSH